ncbi:MAG: Tyrosine recombinase XerC [Syntrophorhabdus sp. PtaU1.Bin002]|nr:MAG: Tyrosine recombinase XerC [Syntrophorhabdus sp. PtaU1.Bin002]
MSTWKSGKKWFYRFQWKGQQILSDGGYDTQEEARLEQAKRKVQLSKTKAIRLDFIKLCDARLSDLKSKRENFYLLDNQNMIQGLIKNEGWALKKEITPLDVATYLDKVAASVSPQRANKYLAYIKALFNFGKRLKLIDDNPSAYIVKYPEKRKSKRVPSHEDVFAVMEICTEEQRDYLWTLALTAARCGEINALKVSDVNFQDNQLTLGTRKTKDGTTEFRKIGMGKMLAEILARRVARAEECRIGYVFFNSRTEEPFNYRSKFLGNKCRKAGVTPPFTYHCMRHYATVVMVQDKKIPLKLVQLVLGHARLSTTDIYTKSLVSVPASATEDLEENVYERYQEFLGSQEKSARAVMEGDK